MQFSLLWIMHISSIFWKIYFPMNAISLKAIRRTKYIHGMCLIAALVLPLISPLASHLKGGFIIIDFPPFTCDGRDAAVTFYVHLFPITIILGVGTSLLVLIFWRLHMVLYSIVYNICNLCNTINICYHSTSRGVIIKCTAMNT